MTVLLIIIGTAFVIALFLLILQKSEIKSILKQIDELLLHESNELVHSENCGISHDLINKINELLKIMRRNQISYNKKSHALEQMITNISHDLRTPLTSAMGYISILQNSDLPESEKKREIDIISKRLVRLEELINSFFELSKVISSGKSPQKDNINIISVLEEAIVHYYDDYQSRSRRIIFNCECRKLIISSNQNMLLRIFDNLVGNALKHGNGDLTVTVEKNDAISVKFQNKLESSDIDMEHIFDEFYTTDISRTKGNTGLGLAIAKQFTEMLDGNIEAVKSGEDFLITVKFRP